MSVRSKRVAAAAPSCPQASDARAAVAGAVAGVLAAAADASVRPGAVWPLHRALLDMRAEAGRRGLPDPLGGAGTAADGHVGEAVDGAAAAVWELRRAADLVPSPDGSPVLVVPPDRRAALRRRLLKVPAEQAALLRWGAQRWNAWECAAANDSRTVVSSPTAQAASFASRLQPPASR